MSVTIEGVTYTENELEAMPLEALKQLAFAEEAEQQRLSAHIAAPGTKTGFAESNKPESVAQSLPLDTIKAAADREKTEAQAKQEELAAQLKQQAEVDALEKQFEGMSLEQIAQAEIEARAKQTIAESPDGKLEQQARDLAQENRDLQYVNEQLRNQSNAQLDSLVERKVAERRNAEAHDIAIAQQFVNSHPDYVACPENLNAIGQFLQGSGFDVTPGKLQDSWLDLAFTVLKQRGQAVVRSAVTEEQPTREPKVRKSSSVSSRSSSGPSLYEPPKRSESDLYDMPLDQLRREADAAAIRAGQQVDRSIIIGGTLGA